MSAVAAIPSGTLLSQGLVHKKVLKLMGNRFELGVVSSDAHFAEHCIDLGIAEIRRIEALLTTFDERSQTNQINAQAGIAPVRVDKEVYELIARAQRISALTQGAFDLTYGSIDKSLWNFDLNMTALPDPETARASVRLIDYRKVLLDPEAQTVFLKEKGMRIGFGGIGKGYAAEMAKRLLKAQGASSGVVNAAGDLSTWGKQPNGHDWTIGIADPNTKHQALASLSISDLAVATSGNYEKYVTIDGKRYSHTIDPKTGMPVSGLKSVTILSPNAEVADALATPVMVMGAEVGIDLIDQLNGVACVVIDEHDRVFASRNIRIH